MFTYQLMLMLSATVARTVALNATDRAFNYSPLNSWADSCYDSGTSSIRWITIRILPPLVRLYLRYGVCTVDCLVKETCENCLILALHVNVFDRAMLDLTKRMMIVLCLSIYNMVQFYHDSETVKLFHNYLILNYLDFPRLS